MIRDVSGVNYRTVLLHVRFRKLHLMQTKAPRTAQKKRLSRKLSLGIRLNLIRLDKNDGRRSVRAEGAAVR